MSKSRNLLRRAITIALAVSLILTSAICASGINRIALAPESSGKIQVYLKPDITIIMNGEEKYFRDVTGAVVYPIIYNGSTYLPIRAISNLMEENIEWSPYNETIFIGRTLSNPNKVKRNTPTDSAISSEGMYIDKPKQTMLSAYLRPNFLVMYDFEVQNFHDEKGNQVFPIVLNGSTYLPIRAISGILKQTIEWDGLNKTVTIVSEETIEPVEEKSAETKALIAQFEKQVLLYDNATVKIQNIQKAITQEELLIIASEVSKDYLTATQHSLEVANMKTAEFSEDERLFYQNLSDFTQVTEQYILILENIAYLVASGQDSSMFVETFVNLVMESQRLFDETSEMAELL